MQRITIKNFWSQDFEECQVQISLLKDLEKTFGSRVRFEYVNADENKNEVSEYNIKNFPTIVIECGDKERERFIGLTQERFLRKAIKKALSECR